MSQPPATKGPERPQKLAWGSCHLFALLRLLARNRFAVDRSRWYLVPRMVAESCLSTLFGIWQQFRLGDELRRAAIAEPPLFVLGHWRSGTTFLHDLLALDPRHTYPNTYECFMPLHFLLTEEYMTRRFPIAGHRQMDDVPSGWDKPQEDEFALAFLGQPSPYLSLAFPNNPPVDEDYLDLEGLPAVRRDAWKRTLYQFLARVARKRPGRLVLKSPPHTGRIRVLRELFPRAKFVHVVRNPYSVIPSTLRTMKVLFHGMGMQEPKYANLEERAFAMYRRMFIRLEEGRQLLAPGQFHELRYEALAHDPVGEVKAIYERLDLGDFEPARPRLEAYVASLGTYKTNRQDLPPALAAAIAQNCAPVLTRYGYGPEAE